MTASYGTDVSSSQPTDADMVGIRTVDPKTLAALAALAELFTKLAAKAERS